MEVKLLTLQTNNIKKMKSFYIETLGFPLVMEDSHSFCIKIGSSKLKFTSENVLGNPYYHFAFNIFANKFEEAKSWVKERVQLNVNNEGEDEVYFSYSQAHSLYFYDPSGNIVEFISRHSISELDEAPFTIESVINISEIGVTVNDVAAAGKRLLEVGINERDNQPLDLTTINFMGDKSKGIYLILNQPGREWFFSNKISAVFPMEIITSQDDTIVVDGEGKLEVS